MYLPSRLSKSLLYLVVFVSSFYFNSSAIAAEKIVLKYKMFQGAVSVSELRTFAQTGEASPSLQFYIRASHQKPENFRKVLIQEFPVNVVTLDRALNNPAGNILLNQVSLAVHPPINAESPEAIRSALVLSASQDNKVSLMEVIQNYPTPTVEIEGEQILRTYRKVNAIIGGARNIIQNQIR
jgi:hypothetical protein